MKKILVIMFSCVYVLLININPAYTKQIVKNFYAYEVYNINIREFGILVKDTVQSYDGPDKGVPLKDVDNAYIYTGDDYTYYVRLYPSNQNTNIFVVSNEDYDVKNNDITQFLNKGGYKYSELKDKGAFKEYQYDFYNLARNQKLGNFYISPDLVKPLKIGITKVNNKLSKYTQKTPELAYSVDSNPINLTCVDTTTYYDTDSKISITKKEYRLKEKTSKYLHAFEYIVSNKNTSTASVTVTTKHHVNLVDVTSETMANMDKVDFIDMTCSSPPAIICTAGLSLLASIPNWVRWAKLTKEATRYSHALPKDYKLRQQGYMRVLVLKQKSNPQPLDFEIKFNENIYHISF